MSLIKYIIHKLNRVFKSEVELLALGKLLSNQQYFIQSKNIQDYEFKIFSQNGDDGIIQFLIKNIEIKNNTFIEFGVEDFSESNCRFLMMNNNWSGFVIDGSEQNMNRLKREKWFWKYDLNTYSTFLTCENINVVLSKSEFENVGILSIDIDGNDYHILNSINFEKLNPSILILEYNSMLGPDASITIPYDPSFYRTNAHYSNLYYGASLKALTGLAEKKGYTLIGSNMAGVNSYYVRNDLMNNKLEKLSVKEAFVQIKCREGRNQDYSLMLDMKKSRSLIKEFKYIEVE